MSLSENTINAILNYLSKKPFIEVVGLIQQIEYELSQEKKDSSEIVKDKKNKSNKNVD